MSGDTAPVEEASTPSSSYGRRKRPARGEKRASRTASSYVGSVYIIGSTQFRDRRGLYLTKMNDYEILSTEDFSDFTVYAPESLKRALSPRWRYSVHISYGTLPSITRDLLYARVIGGQILAYKYLECSIDGNESVYYGFLPSADNYSVQESTHTTARFLMTGVYPRLLYVHLTRSTPCSCSRDCWYWKVMLSDSLIEHAFCGKNIPWSRVYAIMGELDEQCSETVDAKDARECPVCAQCFECSIGARYCRAHRVCKHKQATLLSDSIRPNELAPFESRECKHLKR